MCRAPVGHLQTTKKGSSQQPCEVGFRAHPRCRRPQLSPPPQVSGLRRVGRVQPTRRAVGSVPSISQRVGGYRRGGRGGHAPPPGAVQGLWVQSVRRDVRRASPWLWRLRETQAQVKATCSRPRRLTRAMQTGGPAVRTGKAACSAWGRHLGARMGRAQCSWRAGGAPSHQLPPVHLASTPQPPVSPTSPCPPPTQTSSPEPSCISHLRCLSPH